MFPADYYDSLFRIVDLSAVVQIQSQSGYPDRHVYQQELRPVAWELASMCGCGHSCTVVYELRTKCCKYARNAYYGYITTIILRPSIVSEDYSDNTTTTLSSDPGVVIGSLSQVEKTAIVFKIGTWTCVATNNTMESNSL